MAANKNQPQKQLIKPKTSDNHHKKTATQPLLCKKQTQKSQDRDKI